MEQYKILENIIRKENQEAFDKWLVDNYENTTIGYIFTLIVTTAKDQGSVFGYKQAVKHGYIPSLKDLIHASENGQVDVVEFLLQYVDPNEKIGNSSPLSVAINRSYHDVVDALLRAGAIPSEQEGKIATHQEDINLIHKLYIHGLVPTAKMVEIAINYDNIELVKSILELNPGLNFSFKNVYSKEMAMYFLQKAPTQEQALEMLDSHDPRSGMILILSPELTEMMFDYALEHDSYEALDAILAISERYWLPFNDKVGILAARMNSDALANGYQPGMDSKLDRYDYPIIEAVAAGSYDVLSIFLNKRMSTKVVSFRRLTPLMLAAALNNVSIVQLLLEKNAFIGPIDGHSPLSVAVAHNSLECARILKSNVICSGDECIETIQGHKILIDLTNATPEMKALFI